jgi:site-specific DNA-methyltransferase (adenine-specific)
MGKGMIELNKIYNIDNVQGMRQMEAASVDLTVTSPPYDNLRQYNGYSFDFENVAKELYRVTKQGGVVVWVVNDATIDGDETCTSFRQALFFREIGFKLHDTMIYAKTSVTNYSPSMKRYKQSFEYMFVFAKDTPKTFNPIQDKPVLKQVKMHDGASGRDKNGNLKKNDYYKVGEYQVRFNVWHFNVGYNCTTHDKIAFKHPAIFPEQLAADHIKSWSNEGDLVLDPFMGSGTTAKVARALGRKYIGFEISKEYCDLANKRLQETKTLFD